MGGITEVVGFDLDDTTMPLTYPAYLEWAKRTKDYYPDAKFEDVFWLKDPEETGKG